MPRRRTDLDSAAIASRYSSGESSEAIAASLGCSVGTVKARIREAGVTPRAVGTSGHHSGEAHHAWKGRASSYQAKHQRVRRLRGKAAHCEVCGLDTPDTRYEWANVSGHYDDVNDYRSMCVPCHRRYDDGEMGRGASRRSAMRWRGLA